MKALKFLLAACATFALNAHAGRNADILNHVGNNVILKTYTDLAASAKALSDQVQVLAQQPTPSNFAAAQQGWRDMRVYWEASEAFLFGPVESLAIDPTIDTWPLNRRDLDAVLASNRSLTVDFVRNLGVNLQGFHVVEYLLFGNGETGPNKTVEQLTPREVEYLVSTSALLAEHTGKLAYAWSNNADPDRPNLPGYVKFISQPAPSNPYYKTEQSVLIELVNGMIGIIDEVGNGKLADPMGANAGAANPSLVESPFAWNSLNDFTNNIRSAYSVYTGQCGTSTGPGIRDVVQRVNPQLAAQVEQRLLQAMQRIQDIAGPEKLDFRQAIFDPAARARVQAAMTDLLDLRNLLDKRVLPIVEAED
jgi:putative iron-regulated protein